MKIPWGTILHWGKVSTWKFRIDYRYKLCARNRRRTFNFTPCNLNKEKEIIGTYRNAPVLFIRRLWGLEKSITLVSMLYWVLESEYSFGKIICIVGVRYSKLIKYLWTPDNLFVWIRFQYFLFYPAVIDLGKLSCSFLQYEGKNEWRS